LRPLLSLTADLLPAVVADASRIPELAALPAPIRLVWGQRDPDLNVESARFLATQVPRAKLYVLRRAHHNLQIDEPAAVARLLLPLAGDARLGVVRASAAAGRPRPRGRRGHLRARLEI
jgi:pimeloyl-ACP methyl ester carboxylesterase